MGQGNMRGLEYDGKIKRVAVDALEGQKISSLSDKRTQTDRLLASTKTGGKLNG